MRLSIFVGLLYVAWCINPTTFDASNASIPDLIIVGITFWLALIGDIKELLKKNK